MKNMLKRIKDNWMDISLVLFIIVAIIFLCAGFSKAAFLQL